jgi:predicted DNA-binding protein YlxM (UPF0122 family)
VLDEKDAFLIHFKFFQGASPEIIADHFHITRQAVHKRLNTIIDKIAFAINYGGTG